MHEQDSPAFFMPFSDVTMGNQASGEVLNEVKLDGIKAETCGAAVPSSVSGISDSGHSWKSVLSSSHGDEGDSSAFPSSVQGHLLRAHRKRDPMRYYEIIHILGEGSMGSVAKVKKRDRAKGGSARKDFVKDEQEHRSCCFNALSFFKLRSLVSKFDGTGEIDHVSPLQINTNTSSDLGLKTTVSRTMDSSYHSLTSWNEWMDQKRHKKHNKKEFKHSSSSSLITYGHKDSFFALKSIHLDRCTTKEYVRELKNEVMILKDLDHPNIVKAFETFEYQQRMFIVLELCNGGDLYTRDPYTEEQAARIARSLLSAVAYLHDNQIVHRDLKFENIMFSDKGPQAEIKLIDFGLSQKFARNEHLRDAVGTVYTMAPELLAGDYNQKIDVWSVGVICFMLLSSSMPFYGRDRAHVIRKIISGRYSFASRRWKAISPEAKEFVRELLELDPANRPSAHDALKRMWIKSANGGVDCNDDLFDSIQANIQAYAEYSKLKKLALMVIAYRSTNEEIGVLKSMFSHFDRHQHGEITLPEFKETLSGYYDYSDEELEHMFRGIDIEGTGRVHYTEFLAATMESRGSLDEERLAEAFDRIDSDCTGYITVSDLKEFLGPDIPTAYLDAIIDECDITRDHRISYEEFLELWNGESDQKLEKAKVSVINHRHDSTSRQSSFDSKYNSSLASSMSSEEIFCSDSERDGNMLFVSSSRKSNERDFVCGTLSFQKQKRELSLRGGQQTVQSA